MNKIYLEISKLSDKFREMCYGLTQDKVQINDAVQELMLYFLQMNPEILKKIYDKDGLDGITRYGAVVLRRALTSVRSPFYYQYNKYYTHIDSFTSNVTYDVIETGEVVPTKHLYNIAEPPVVKNLEFEKLDKIDLVLNDLYWYDRKVFQLYYYENNTLDTLAKKTGISRNSLFTTIDKVRTILKKELTDE
jgi:RNA polymerase sigma factor (sigma-70 family)|tara:strand:- start:221 stop:793 length:573 start_codon:yes stop_codon:yes gene_type:complete